MAARKKITCSVGDQYLFDHRIMVNVPILFVKRLLTVCAIPISNRDGFYGIIPKLALLPLTNLFGSELCGFEGRGRVFGGPSTLRRMTVRVCTDATFISLRPLWLRSRRNILCYVWRAKSGRAAFTTPLGPIVWSTALAICF